MSNHVATITKDEGRCSFSRKALSVFMAVLLAFLMMPMVPAESALAAASAGDEADAWKLNTVEYTVQKNDQDAYVTTVDDIFTVKSVTEYGTGRVLPTTDYTLVYFDDDVAGDPVTKSTSPAAAPSIDGDFGGAPNEAGNYILRVYKGKLAEPADNTTLAGYTPQWADSSTAGTPNAQAYTEVHFTIEPETTALADVDAYEQNTSDPDDFSDTSFAYRGSDLEIGFVMGGKQVDLDQVDVVWTDYATAGAPSSTATDDIITIDAADLKAGDYALKLTAKSSSADYSGSTTVSFTVAPIDLSNDEIAIAPTVSLDVTATTNAQIETSQVLVNGEPLAASLNSAIGGALIAIDNAPNTTAPADPITSANAGTYTFRFADADKDDPNVVGGAKTVDAAVVNAMVSYYYKGGTTAIDDSNDIDVNLFYGDVLNPEWLTAEYNDGAKDVEIDDFTWRLEDANGNEVAPADIVDGTYYLYLETPVFSRADSTNTMKSYAGYEKVTVNVTGPNYNDAKVFITVDGKYLNGTARPAFEYTGSAYEPSVVAKNGDDALVEGEDYTVEVTKDGEAVESILELGDYDITVKFADNDEKNEVVGQMKVEKATIESAKATAEFYALPADGSAAAPAFTGSTDKVYEDGQVFDLPADQISVEYTAVEESGYYDADGNAIYVKKSGANAVSGDELTESGMYAAEITVLTTAPYIDTDNTVSAFGIVAANKSYDAKGAANANPINNAVVSEGLMFQVTASAAYADVAADAWYAESVYTAASEGFGYMTGIPGTNLFLPEGQITRAQVAQVLYNMAGGNLDPSQSYPTQFTDVEPDAWYAAPIFWASQAGIVTGIGDTGTFAPNDPVTREQVATMLWRYMKAQGKDVSGSADLAAYADGSSVSGWAAEAMAWAVDAEVFGVGTDVLRPQDDMSRVEMAATAVRVQPDGMIERA